MPPWIWPSTSVGIDGAADVVRGHDPAHLHGAKAEIDIHGGDLRGKTVGGVGNALALGVQRPGRRIEGADGFERDAVALVGQLREIHRRLLTAVGDDQARAVEADARVGTGVGEAQDFRAQRLARQLRGLAGHERLARGGRLAGIEGEVGIADDQLERRHRQPERIGGDLGEHRGRALADVDGAVPEGERAVARQRQPHGGRVGEAGVADAVPHAADADAAPRGAGAGVECGGFCEQSLPARPQRVEARRQSGAGFEHLPGGRRVAGAQRVDMAELEAVEAGFLRQIVEQGLVRDGGLRHAEAAEGAGGRVVGVDGARIVFAHAERDTVPSHARARGPPPSAPRRRRRRY